MVLRTLRRIPSDARAILLLTCAGGLAVAAMALGRLTQTPPSLGQIAFALLLADAAVLVQIRSPSLVWRGRRISVHPDEALLLLAFAALPVELVVALALAAAAASQLISRRPLVKTAFNVSAHVLASGAAALVVSAAVDAGLAPTEAALAAPFVVSVVSQGLVASLLARLGREPWSAVAKPELVVSVGVASIVGTTLGVLALSLYARHPLAIVALVPVAWMLFRVMGLEYRHRNELAARRALSEASAKLAAVAADEEAIDAARQAAFELFDLSQLEVRLVDGRVRSWSRPETAGPQKDLHFPLLGPGGDPLGDVRVRAAERGDARAEEDRQLLALVAGNLSLALASARARQARERAEKLVALQDLVKGIAHEINNPVMYAAGPLDLVLMDLEAAAPLEREELAEQIRVARRGLTRIETVSRALAEVAASDGAFDDAVDLGQLATDVAAAGGVAILVPPEPVRVRGSRADLRRALEKLVENAVDASGATRARVVVQRAGAFAEVVVSDEGKGVPAEDRAHLFSPFFTTKPDGLGLGLTTALRIARDHRGDIVYEDAGGGGARFRLRVPLEVEGAPTAGESRKPARVRLFGMGARPVAPTPRENA